MSDQFSFLPPAEAHESAPPKANSRKQRAVMAHFREHETLSLDDAVKLIGGDIYANRKFHVGNLLRNMVRRGLIRKIKTALWGRIE